jgi:hypothetical protein
MPDYFPPALPTVAGVRITVDAFLNNPARVQKVIADLTAQRFIADRIFSPGPSAAGTGAVIYDQVMANELYTQRDVQSIEPGSYFPILNQVEAAPLVAKTVKWGGAARFTDEQVERDRRDVVQRGLTQIRNTIIRKVDTVAVATLRAAPIQQALASSSWTNSAAAIVKDVQTGKTAVDKLDMGYEITDALISPTTALNMITNDKLLSLLPREGMGGMPNPIESGELRGVLGLSWYSTNRVSDDEVLLVSGRTAGSISDEKPLYSRVVDERAREARLVMAARLVVPYVTDPLSVVRITGVQ